MAINQNVIFTNYLMKKMIFILELNLKSILTITIQLL